MADELVRLHLKEPDLLAVAVICTDTARHASSLHRCAPTSAQLLGQAFAAGFGVAGLLHGRARINLQLTCDGPAQGLFVDADAEGRARGYIRNPSVNFGAGPRFDPAPALGSNGMLSVLRELKAGEYYRGSVALERFDLAQDLERYYRESEQIETAVAVELESSSELPLAKVSALLVQSMPGVQEGALPAAREVIARKPAHAERALDLLRPLLDRFPGEWDLLAQYPLGYQCGCSADGVVRAVIAMGRAEIENLLETQGHAKATCAFCGTVYQVSGERLREILEDAEEE